MDSFDFKPEKRVVPRKKGMIWYILTVLLLIGIACLGYFYISIFLNPASPLNPFPPRPTATLYSTETATITPLQLPATYTPSQTMGRSPTRTKAPTWTPLPNMVTPTITETPTDTLEPSITPTPGLAIANISYMASTQFFPDSSCQWLGVGGQVFDAKGKPLSNQTIQLGGTLGEKTVTDLTVSGLTPKELFGDAGFDFILGNAPIASTQTLWVQLFDNTGKQLTEKIYFDTFTECDKNLVLVNFYLTR